MDCAQKTPGVSGRSTASITLQNHVFVTPIKSTYLWVPEIQHFQAA